MNNTRKQTTGTPTRGWKGPYREPRSGASSNTTQRRNRGRTTTSSNRNGLEIRAGIHGASSSCSGSKVLALHSIPMTLDAFSKTSLHTEGLFAHTHDGGQAERGKASRDT